MRHTHIAILGKENMEGHTDSEVEDIHIVLCGHLELVKGVHLHDGPPRVDGKQGAGIAVGHQGGSH